MRVHQCNSGSSFLLKDYYNFNKYFKAHFQAIICVNSLQRKKSVSLCILKQGQLFISLGHSLKLSSGYTN